MQLTMPKICSIAELEKYFTDPQSGRIYVTAREIREDCRNQCFPNRKKGKSYYLYEEAAIAYYQQKFETFDGHKCRPEQKPVVSQRKAAVATKQLAAYQPKKASQKELSFKEKVRALKARSAAG